ncbi:DUF2802 domain-containing protein [Methylohalobius crimeensis]|uniref:DUF2802 domain-containing protein n=1 Tax=Methylohalobius crimeensis TaxID=244365 RepID=UPI0003B6FEA9|nr:DUF2802 domain-containing protein [Methylohalobius crimeensis]
MDGPIFYLALGILSCAVLSLAGILIGLWRRQSRLVRRVDQWQKNQERLQRDLAGLCAAAVRMDERFLELSGRLEGIQQWTQEAGHEQGSTYQTAIERIREGADVEELVSEWGFSREEAELLIRMHRADGVAGKGSYSDA